MSQPIGRRLLALVALLANGAALVLVVDSLFDNLGALIVGVACLALSLRADGLAVYAIRGARIVTVPMKRACEHGSHVPRSTWNHDLHRRTAHPVQSCVECMTMV